MLQMKNREKKGRGGGRDSCLSVRQSVRLLIGLELSFIQEMNEVGIRVARLAPLHYMHLESDTVKRRYSGRFDEYADPIEFPLGARCDPKNLKC